MLKPFRYILLAALMATPLAQADDVADGAVALNNKSYAEALRLFSKAASAGNAQAQFQLGEMYFYGEGIPVDEKTAAGWFQKSAAAGNKDAVEALARIDRRHASQDKIAFWVSKYDGADLTKGRFACAAPVIPDVSSATAEITKVGADYSAWRDCHNAFLDNLSALLPVGKQIPSDIEILMTDDELMRARSHLGQVYKTVAAGRTSEAALVVARYDDWTSRTKVLVKANNDDLQRRNYEHLLANDRNYSHSDGSNPTGPQGVTKGNGR